MAEVVSQKQLITFTVYRPASTRIRDGGMFWGTHFDLDQRTVCRTLVMKLVKLIPAQFVKPPIL